MRLWAQVGQCFGHKAAVLQELTRPPPPECPKLPGQLLCVALDLVLSTIVRWPNFSGGTVWAQASIGTGKLTIRAAGGLHRVVGLVVLFSSKARCFNSGPRNAVTRSTRSRVKRCSCSLESNGKWIDDSRNFSTILSFADTQRRGL